MNVRFLMAHSCTSQIAPSFSIPFSCLFPPLCVLPFLLSLAPPLFAVSWFGSFSSNLRCFLRIFHISCLSLPHLHTSGLFPALYFFVRCILCLRFLFVLMFSWMCVCFLVVLFIWSCYLQLQWLLIFFNWGGVGVGEATWEHQRCGNV